MRGQGQVTGKQTVTVKPATVALVLAGVAKRPRRHEEHWPERHFLREGAQ